MRRFDSGKSNIMNKLLPIYHLLQAYHRHEIEGENNIAPSGRLLVAVNHSLATYDIFMLAMGLYLATGRRAYFLADRNFFKFDLVAQMVEQLNFVEANQKNGERLLEREELVIVAPGGMKEALRSSQAQGEILWDERQGISRLALRTQTPVVLAACPAADQIFSVYPSVLTDLVYEKYRLPFVLLRGLGPTPLPRPVQLTHFISAPQVPPAQVEGAPAPETAVELFHQQLIEKMDEMLRS